MKCKTAFNMIEQIAKEHFKSGNAFFFDLNNEVA